MGSKVAHNSNSNFDLVSDVMGDIRGKRFQKIGSQFFLKIVNSLQWESYTPTKIGVNLGDP